MMLELHARELSKTFEQPGLDAVRALERVSLTIRSGEFVVVVGPNGSGKSTLLRLIDGTLFPDHGTLELRSEGVTSDWTGLDRRERSMRVARVHQNPALGTVPDLTVRENLRAASIRAPILSPVPLPRNGDAGVSSRLQQIGLAHRANTLVRHLSGGERQLLALELALVRRPFLLLLDEFTASLDPRHARVCLEAAVRLTQKEGVAVILVTHSLPDALAYGEHLLVLRSGEVVAEFAGDDKRALSVADLLRTCGYV